MTTDHIPRLKNGAIDYDFRPSTLEELGACLSDPMWRICSGFLYKIIIKGDDENDEGLIMPFRPNRAQKRFLRRLWHRNVILKARQLGFCVSPDTRVLTADLEWLPIGQIKPGTDVIACDEHPPGGRGSARKMRTATVQAVKTMRAERFRIKFDDGREVVCTDRHPWLSKKVATDAKWRSISGDGNSVTGKLTVGTKVRWVAKPWDEPTFEDGWFGGMLDGEGSIAKSNSSAGINVSQRHGPVWDRLVRYANDRGYNACIENDVAERPSKHGRLPVPKLAFGRMDEMFRLIGQTRPSRFAGNRFWEGRELPGKRNGGVGWATVTSIEAIGEGDVVDMQTTTGTYIAEGFVSHNTTLIAIVWLDHALFNANSRCGIVAQDEGAAKVIFRDKVKFAYRNLPDAIRQRFPLEADNADELLFAHNNSSIRVATSMRSGTIHRLHVSEFGKICAKYPDKAQEVIKGSIPSVPLTGITVIESTAEGRSGEFFNIVQKAGALADAGRELNQRDYRLHFYAWHDNDQYRMPAHGVIIPPSVADYLDTVESKIGKDLDADQRAWYAATLDGDFSGDMESMRQEYPSTRDEPFLVSTEGCWFTQQMAAARKAGRICKLPALTSQPCWTFWDIGSSDGMAVWVMQKVGQEYRLVNFAEWWGEPYATATSWLQSLGLMWECMYLPHDAEHERQGQTLNKTPRQMLEALMPGVRFEVVPRIEDVTWGIQQTRDVFPMLWFDEEACADGIVHLDLYGKKWNKQQAAWSDVPDKSTGHSEAADALRQFAQAYANGQLNVNKISNKIPRRSGWRTA